MNRTVARLITAVVLAACVVQPMRARAEDALPVYESIVVWMGVGICLHTKAGVALQEASQLVYGQAKQQFNLSGQEVDAYVTRPSFQQDVSAAIDELGGCDKILAEVAKAAGKRDQP